MLLGSLYRPRVMGCTTRRPLQAPSEEARVFGLGRKCRDPQTQRRVRSAHECHRAFTYRVAEKTDYRGLFCDSAFSPRRQLPGLARLRRGARRHDHDPSAPRTVSNATAVRLFGVDLLQFRCLPCGLPELLRAERRLATWRELSMACSIAQLFQTT